MHGKSGAAKHPRGRIMNRRQFLQATGLAGTALALGAGCPPVSSEQPNVLFLVVDQMRSPRWFPQDLEFPAFNRLRAEGLSFGNHFTSAVPCSPSRASLFTGLHLPQHGVYTNVAQTKQNMGNESLDPALPTMGQLFQQAGYRTPYFGKWHLTTPKDYEEDGLALYGYEEWQGPDHVGQPRQGHFYDPLFADQAIRWLREHGRNGPWLLTCSLINPHDIVTYQRASRSAFLVPNVTDQLPGNFEDSLEDKPRIQAQYQRIWAIGTGMQPRQPDDLWREYVDLYYCLTREVDARVADILDALDRLGLSENTLVVFTSDHGEMAGSHRLQGKGPFVYQENNHVPLILRWPGRVPAGVETAALSQSVDVLPTLLDLMGISAPPDPLSGKSLAPLLDDPAGAGVNDHILMAFGYSTIPQAIQRRPQFVPIPLLAPMQIHAIFDGRFKYARYFDIAVEEEEYELYDLLNDPLEMTNLANNPDSDAIRQEMAARLLEAEQTEMAPRTTT